MSKEQDLQRLLPEGIFGLIQKSGIVIDKLQEIRMNIGQPLLLQYGGRELILNESGQRVKSSGQAHQVTPQEVHETFEFMCCHSVYAHEEEIRQGFLTVEGGHRIGIAGQAVWEQGKLCRLKYISALNIRLASQVLDCAHRILPYLYEEDEFCHTLIIAAPCAGKTTLLRDCIRLLSDGCRDRAGVRVGVVDERGEIGACYRGVPQNRLGARTDILDRVPKAQGISMLIRTMAPKIIAVDEIGSPQDMQALADASLSGCKILATIHGGSLEEIFEKPMLWGKGFKESFQRFVLLKSGSQGEIQGIYNQKKECLW
ncbi:MAG: stage III sporulation protein AA [Lachnospiraceae bacterium]|nr:stage III sporulation protein AA [Lachnospiraceae bacterium]